MGCCPVTQQYAKYCMDLCLYGIVVYRYPTRIEAMVVKLEFSEKLEDIKPGIRTLEIAIDGNTL